MISKIPDEIEVPEELMLAAGSKKLVPFVGAGASMLIGYPNWNGLADAALQYLLRKEKLNFSEIDQIAKQHPRTKLSLAIAIESSLGIRIEFDKIFEQYANEASKNRSESIYKHIFRLASRSNLFVTTNYDKELDEDTFTPIASENTEDSDTRPSGKRHLVYQPEEIEINCLDFKNCTIHIHGSILDRNSMTMTTSDYLNQYRNHDVVGGKIDENRYLRFLEQLFKVKNVLFIGYGAEELEILEYVLSKSQAPTSSVIPKTTLSPRHFLLQGFYKTQLPLARNLALYFAQFGITLLPFSKDRRGWSSMNDAVEKLANTLPTGSERKTVKKSEMESLIK